MGFCSRVPMKPHRRSGVPRPNLSKIECGKKDASLQTLRMLATALDVTPGSLVDGIAPGLYSQAAKGLSRTTLDKIARSAYTGRKLSNPKHQTLADNLRIVTGPRIRAINPKHKVSSRIGRKTDIAWLKLSALPSAERENLIKRVISHAAIAGIKPPENI